MLHLVYAKLIRTVEQMSYKQSLSTPSPSPLPLKGGEDNKFIPSPLRGEDKGEGAKSHRAVEILFLIIPFIFFLNFLSISSYAGDAILSWNPPTTNADGSPLTDLAGYKVYYGTASINYSQTINVGNVTTYTATNLTNGTNYYFAVTAYDTSGNESTYSNEVSKTIQTVDTTPPVISGVYASNINSSSATIIWTTNEASDTQVEYGTTTSYGYTTTLNTSLVTTHSQAINNLSPSTIYHYRVKSRDASGNLAVSGDYTFTTSAPADTTPPTISNIQAANITSSSVTITWATNEASTTQVEYGLTTSYGNMTTLNSSLVTNHSATITGLSSFTTYNFRVRSKDASGNEAVSGNNTFKTSNTAPSISSFSATPTTGTTPLLANFSASATDQDGYIVSYEWDIDGNGTYEVNTGTVATTSLTYTNAGTYNTRVRATDNGGASVVSGIVTITVSSPINQPPVISSLTANPTSGTAPLTVTFSITASDSDGSIAQYEWDFDGNATYDAVTTTHPVSNTYTNAGTYTTKVRVTDNQGATATDNIIITVNSPSPADVQNFTATPGNAQISLSWINPDDPNFAGVRIRYRTDGKYPTDKDDGILVGDFPGNKGEAKSFLHTGLQNGAMYYYSAFSYDAIGNYSHTAYASTAPSESSASESGGMEEVSINGGGCFIATAAYGSYLDSHVIVLRDFRDHYLLTNAPGRALVAFYYKISPPVADIISRHEGLKTVVRLLLTPLIIGIKYAHWAIIIFTITVGIMIYLKYFRETFLGQTLTSRWRTKRMKIRLTPINPLLPKSGSKSPLLK